MCSLIFFVIFIMSIGLCPITSPRQSSGTIVRLLLQSCRSCFLMYGPDFFCDLGARLLLRPDDPGERLAHCDGLHERLVGHTIVPPVVGPTVTRPHDPERESRKDTPESRPCHPADRSGALLKARRSCLHDLPPEHRRGAARPRARREVRYHGPPAADPGLGSDRVVRVGGQGPDRAWLAGWGDRDRAIGPRVSSRRPRDRARPGTHSERVAPRPASLARGVPRAADNPGRDDDSFTLRSEDSFSERSRGRPRGIVQSSQAACYRHTGRTLHRTVAVSRDMGASPLWATRPT